MQEWPRGDLLQDMREVFQLAAKGEDGRLRGSSGKKSYLTSTLFTPQRLKKNVRPPILYNLMELAREPFGHIYAKSVVITETPDCIDPSLPVEDELAEAKKVESTIPDMVDDKVAEAEKVESKRRYYVDEMIRSSRLLKKHYARCLSNDDRWPKDDKATDNFPRDLRMQYPAASSLKRKSDTAGLRWYPAGSGHRNVVQRTDVGTDTSSSSRQYEGSVAVSDDDEE